MTNLFLIVVLIAGNAFARPHMAKTWEAGPYIGGAFFDDYRNLEPDNAFLLGARLGYFLSDPWSVEGAYHRAFSQDANGDEANFDAFRFNVLYHFDFPLQPFLTVGGVVERADFASVSEYTISPNIGVGARYSFNDWFGLRMEGRYIPPKVGGTVDQTQNNFEILAGLSFFFHRKAEEAAPAPTVEATPAPAAEPTAPQVADADHDGVADEKDTCPDTPTGVSVDDTGCRPKESIARGALRGVEFDLMKSTLTPESQKILDEVAQVLKTYPEGSIEVQGHTDDMGDEGFNQNLSEARAKSVKEYLVSKGVDSNRLTHKGYGESKPIADNKTRDGRKSNRRVVLEWAK